MKKGHKICIGIIVLLVVFRLILPSIVLFYSNRTLEKMNGYYGHINDIDISLYRGAYVINGIYINKLDTVSKKQTEFFKSPVIDLSIEWSALIHGRIVGKITFDSPTLVFTKNKVEFNDVKKDTASFQKLLDNFMPLKVNRFEINNGEIHYADKSSKHNLDIALKHAHILALNLSNVVNKEVELPSSVTGEASAYEGKLNFDMRLNALASSATFDLNVEMKNANLVLLNNFFMTYGKFNVSRGTIAIYMEMAAKEGKFVGYVKPVIKNLEVVGSKDSNHAFFHKVFESAIGFAGVVLKNQRKDQIATKVHIEGDFKNPKIYTLGAVWEIIKNAFIQAIIPSLDNDININSVVDDPKYKHKFLDKIFPGKKGEKNK
jgi:hypothetical protein